MWPPGTSTAAPCSTRSWLSTRWRERSATSSPPAPPWPRRAKRFSSPLSAKAAGRSSPSDAAASSLLGWRRRSAGHLERHLAPDDAAALPDLYLRLVVAFGELGKLHVGKIGELALVLAGGIEKPAVS